MFWPTPQIAEVPGAISTVVSILERYASQPASSSSSSSAAAATAAAEESSDPAPEPAATSGGSEAAAGAPGVPRADSKLSRAAYREDCVVKMLRLLANLAIHPDVRRGRLGCVYRTFHPDS